MLMIRKVKLVNWTSHKESELEFENANIFLGVIGSGKSSVVEAISFALFGSFPELNSRELSLVDLIRHGERRAKVELFLELKGKEIKIIREIEKTKDKAKTSSKLFVDNALFSESTTEVNNFLSSFFGFDFHTFINTLYSSQNRLEGLLYLSPSKRRALLDELMNIEKLERALKNTTSFLNRAQRLQKDLESKLKNAEEERLEKEVEKKEREIEELKKKREEIKTLKEKEERELELLKAKYRKLKEERELYYSLVKEKERLNALCEELKPYKDFSSSFDEKELLKEKEIFEELRALIREKRRELEETRLKLIRIREEILKQEKILEEIEIVKERIKRLEGVELFLENLLKKEQELVSNISRVNEKIRSSKDSLKLLEGDSPFCPVCGKELSISSKKELKEKLEKEIEYNSKKLKELEKELLGLRKDIEIKRRNLSNLERLKERLSILEKDLKKVDKNLISSLEEKEKSLRKEFEEIEQKKEACLRKINDLENQLKEIKEKEGKKRKYWFSFSRKKKIEEKLEGLSFNEESFSSLIESLKELSSSLEKKKTFLSQSKLLLEEKEKLLRELKKRREEINKMRKKMEKLSSLIEDLSIIKTALTTTQQEARKHLLDSLNFSLNMIWGIIYPYEDYVKVKVEAFESGYRFLVFDGEWKELERVASGGEKSLYMLSLRLALSSLLMGKLDFVILDEPTHNLDEFAVERLSLLISSELSKLTKQFFIITHDERLRNIERGKVFLFERNKKGSSPTVVKVLQ